jgi:hypothetical protein
MSRSRLISFLVFILLIYSQVPTVQAQSGVQLVSDNASLSFPNTATFQAEFKSGANITSVVLEYGLDQLTCGTVIAKGYPQLTPATDVQVQWAWDMRQSGSVAPGATLWWQWLVEDANGSKFTSPKQTILWLDDVHNWQVIPGGNINLHYYNGGQSFGQALHDAAAQALVRLSDYVGIQADKPIDIYIYANTNDLKDAILYEPSWVGGEAFPEDDIVIIGVSPDQLDWGKGAEAHELTHVLVGHITFSCLGFIPTWLNEGLAMFGEGGPQPSALTQFNQAVTSNQLLALGSLAGSFSDESNRADLSYTEAYSVVNYMIQTFGRDKMLRLLISLRDGATADDALQSVYGFDTSGLEEVWRASIGAAPLSTSGTPTPIPTPTVVPTIIPVGAAPLAQSSPVGETVVPATTVPAATDTPVPAATGVPLSQQLGLNQDIIFWIGVGVGGCFLAVLVIAVPIILTTRRHRRQK